MIDIEHKSLRLIQYNIAVLDSLLNCREFLKKFINESITIEDWSPNKRIRLYYEIVNRVLDNSDINGFYRSLDSLAMAYEKENDTDVKLFYATAIDFRVFLKKVYDIYLLDQLYFILVNVPLDEVLEYKNGFKTGSYFESVNFGLGFEQSSLFDNEFNRYDQELYNIKLFIVGNIKVLLEKTEYQDKRRKLLESLRRNRKESIYFDGLVELLESFKCDKVRRRMRINS